MVSERESSKLTNRRFVNFERNCKLIEESKNQAKYEFEVTEDTMNSVRTLHGGCTATILNYCMGNAISHELHKKPVTIELCISYLNGAKLGDILIIETFLIKKGSNLAFINAEVYRKVDGLPIAICKKTAAFSRESKL